MGLGRINHVLIIYCACRTSSKRMKISFYINLTLRKRLIVFIVSSLENNGKYGMQLNISTIIQEMHDGSKCSVRYDIHVSTSD